MFGYETHLKNSVLKQLYNVMQETGRSIVTFNHTESLNCLFCSSTCLSTSTEIVYIKFSLCLWGNSGPDLLLFRCSGNDESEYIAESALHMDLVFLKCYGLMNNDCLVSYCFHSKLFDNLANFYSFVALSLAKYWTMRGADRDEELVN